MTNTIFSIAFINDNKEIKKFYYDIPHTINNGIVAYGCRGKYLCPNNEEKINVFLYTDSKHTECKITKIVAYPKVYKSINIAKRSINRINWTRYTNEKLTPVIVEFNDMHNIINTYTV